MTGMQRFTDQVAVVTGAATGIGAATARRLAAEGAAVVLGDVDTERGERTAAALRAEGARATFVRADVADAADWQRVLDAAHVHGPVRVLVSNAYTVDLAPAGEMTQASWERQVAVNLTGGFLGFRAVQPDLSEHGGAVVYTSSVHARMGLPGRPAYAATKGAVLSLCSQLAVEYGPSIRVNAVLPGPILTGAWDGIGEEDRARSVAETAAARFGTPDEVAAAIAFLASAEAGYITGTSLVVDGGWSVLKSSS
ncbi:SDR family oxidoreductase [Streptomyces sp. SID5785]|uniref:SDR family NAD(P)-dependent oxidoreductase n=1 Tax=Streptomyces sp. SID5785 TaxID=2690309 RepID=UPI001361E528|nr:SDR family oxidoreductase [Streptomyces sp. SID5785]MZD03518.1 SDR family oxidoreductase [Streptomyces sp. SID5785]